MDISRRRFLTLSTGSVAGLAVAGAAVKTATASGGLPPGKVLHGTQTTTICPFCATGCGFVVTTDGGKVVNIEGDPEHPINKGGACAKGSALAQISDNPRRLSKVLYRRPGGTEWEEKTWDWALEKIAKRIKATRDTTWTAKDDQGRLVNRAEGIASLGGAALDNEECYALVKALRALGVTRIEHQARV